uniref:Uncharacterized protein n=1 Tax=Rhizophora mucronata TaxID=61149 RepID=A0A2P2PFD9_RHIMU
MFCDLRNNGASKETLFPPLFLFFVPSGCFLGGIQIINLQQTIFPQFLYEMDALV